MIFRCRRARSTRLSGTEPMAVYTEVADEELRAFLADYELGELDRLQGIAEGVENSNYLLQTDGRPLHPDALREARRSGRPAVLPRPDGASGGARPRLPAAGACARRRRRCATLAGRPAAIVTFLPGVWPRRVRREHCARARRGAGAAASGRRRLRRSRRANALSVAGWAPLLDARRRARRRGAAGARRRLIADGARRHPAADWPTGLPRGRDPRRPVPRQRLLPRRPAVRADRLLLRLHRPPRLRHRDLPERLVLRAGRLVQRHQGAGAAAAL